MSYTSSGISFPGLGIDEFVIDRTAFTIFGKDVAWYGIIIAIGMAAAVMYVIYRARQHVGISTDDVFDYALAMIFFGVVGARLYYVLTSDSYYTFADAFKIWNGGLAIYGGIIGGGLAAIAVSYFKGVRPQCFLDMVGPGVMIAQAIGRWGNFCNGECFGGPTTLPWGMNLTHLRGDKVVQVFGTVHPTFLYESLWNVLGFVLINIFYKKRKFDGQIFLMYIAWYGLGRGFIEGMRTDSLYVGPFRISQVLGFASFIIAVALIIVGYFKGKLYETAVTDARLKKLSEIHEKEKAERLAESESTLGLNIKKENEDIEINEKENDGGQENGNDN